MNDRESRRIPLWFQMSALAALMAAGTAAAQQDAAPEPQAAGLTEVVVTARGSATSACKTSR